MKNIVKSFLKSEAGNFGVMLGLTLTPLMMSVGVGLDYAGYKRMEHRMTLAAEAAMLAGSKKVKFLREQDYADDGEYDMTNEELVEELDAVFKPFFESNFAAGGYELQEHQYNLEYIEADNNTKVRVTMDYNTAVMPVFGYTAITAEREMIINLKSQPENYVIDIVMCIDATGSMQNTLNAVKANAKTFNADLRQELGVGPNSEKLKIRIRPIFYRDWEEGQDYLNDYAQYQSDLAAFEEDYEEWETGTPGTPGISDDDREEFIDEWNDSSWYYKNWRRWKKSRHWWHPKTHKRIKHERKWYYFRDEEELNAWLDEEFGGTSGTAGGEGDPPEAPEAPINHGLNIYGDFIDLDPSLSSGDTKAEQNQKFEDFLGSTYAFGGHDWPEAAGACLNEAIRSNWYDNQSDEAREYFEVPNGQTIIQEGDEIPIQAYTKITPVPVIVFWSDATINSLQKSRDYLSATTPTSWTTFQNLWNGTIPSGDPDETRGVAANSSGRDIIDQDHKLLIRFGPSNASGFTTIDTWDRTHYGGSLSYGNDDAVKMIAKKIMESFPDLLRVGT